jgi:hypothetical protein
MGANTHGKEAAVMFFALVLLLTIGCIAYILAPAGHRGLRPDDLRGRIQARGWGLLLLPVAMAAAVMAGGAHGLIPAELGIAAQAIVFAPKLAGRLVPFGVFGLARPAATRPRPEPAWPEWSAGSRRLMASWP